MAAEKPVVDATRNKTNASALAMNSRRRKTHTDARDEADALDEIFSMGMSKRGIDGFFVGGAEIWTSSLELPITRFREQS
jgi:hypothetical protein